MLSIAGPFTIQLEYPNTGGELDTGVLSGSLLGVGLRHTFDGGTSLDIDISVKGDTAIPFDILSLTGSDTDQWYFFSAPISDANGSPIDGLYRQGIPIYDKINVAIENGGDNDKLELWLMLEV